MAYRQTYGRARDRGDRGAGEASAQREVAAEKEEEETPLNGRRATGDGRRARAAGDGCAPSRDYPRRALCSSPPAARRPSPIAPVQILFTFHDPRRNNTVPLTAYVENAIASAT